MSTPSAPPARKATGAGWSSRIPGNDCTPSNAAAVLRWLDQTKTSTGTGSQSSAVVAPTMSACEHGFRFGLDPRRIRQTARHEPPSTGTTSRR